MSERSRPHCGHTLNRSPPTAPRPPPPRTSERGGAARTHRSSWEELCGTSPAQDRHHWRLVRSPTKDDHRGNDWCPHRRDSRLRARLHRGLLLDRLGSDQRWIFDAERCVVGCLGRRHGYEPGLPRSAGLLGRERSWGWTESCRYLRRSVQGRPRLCARSVRVYYERPADVLRAVYTRLHARGSGEQRSQPRTPSLLTVGGDSQRRARGRPTRPRYALVVCNRPPP